MGFFAKVFIVIAIVAALAFAVYAVPPVQTTATTTSEGYLIEAPPKIYFQHQADYLLEYHMNNESNGRPVTDISDGGLECHFELFNNTGFIVMNYTPVYNEGTKNFDVPISAGNFSHLGSMYYHIDCNSSSLGGTDLVPIFITENGEQTLHSENNSSSTALAVTLFILIINVMLFLIPLVKKEMLENPFANLILRRSLMSLGFYLAVLNTAIVQTLAVSAGLVLNAEMARYMFLLGTAGYIMLASTVLKTLFDLVTSYRIGKQNERMGEE